MRAPQTIIKRPMLTEKSTTLRETGGSDYVFEEGDVFSQKVVFEVAGDANKIEIRQAVESLFGVKVVKVHTMIQRGKLRRVGRYVGRLSPRKKAIVTLAPGDTIEFFEGV